MPTSIYTLADPVSGEIRYVGKTTQKPKTRLKSHWVQARWKKQSYDTWVARWVRSLPERPVMNVLLITEDVFGCEMERRVIALYRKLSYRLTNLTDGGDGMPGYKLTLEQRAKRLGHTWGFKKGHQMTPEDRAAQIALMQGNKYASRKHTLEETARRAASLRRTLAIKRGVLIKGEGWEAFPLDRSSVRRLRQEYKVAQSLGLPFVRHLAVRKYFYG